ncbi:MAG: ArsA-related P-loop ATPase [Candidatus Lernaella stagnicola]|nr:ArsA-related P-loop ATPase [Candidatus Lernaella stagnicola]
MSAGLLEHIADKRIVICVGSGGVGKTTLAAAIALGAAIAGRKTLVLTIDPARRLANSLGLEELDNTETRIPAAVFSAAKIKPQGELWGMMLDVKRTFDELIKRIAPTDDAAERILENHYYQNLSDALAGSQEYMAMEKLHEVQAERDYDLIVVDTPPTKHALDFLEAPARMEDFLNGKVIQWFLKPYMVAGKVGAAFAQRSAAMTFKMLERFTGYEAMADLAEFFLAFDGMYEGFKERARHVKELLAAEDTAFVLVTSPASPAIEEAEFFYTRLTRDRMRPLAVVFNRVHVWEGGENGEFADALVGAGEKLIAKLPAYAPAIDAVIDNAAGMIQMAAADKKAVERFLEKTQHGREAFRIPAFATDVHDLQSLAELGAFLI